MSYTDTITIILNILTVFSAGVFVIISSVIVIATAYLLFRFGWRTVITDQSLMLGGYYLRKTPIKGYNRFRSQAWNYKNQPWNK